MRSNDEIDAFEKVIGQLNMLIKDFYDLSKKKPSETVNIFKLSLVNAILEKINTIIDESDKPFLSFSEFSEDELPFNSDVLVVLNQYHECSRMFAEKNIEKFSHITYWVINNERTSRSVSINKLFGDWYE